MPLFDVIAHPANRGRPNEAAQVVLDTGLGYFRETKTRA